MISEVFFIGRSINNVIIIDFKKGFFPLALYVVWSPNQTDQKIS